MQDDEISAKEAAKLIGISPYSLANKRYAGKGPKYKHRKARVVYKRSDVLDWLNRIR